MGKLRIGSFAGLTLAFLACGERQKTVRELNPVLYVHRFDSAAYAIRINQPEAIYPIHGLPFIEGPRAGWKSAWLFVPDTMGRIPGNRVRESARGFSPKHAEPHGPASDGIEFGKGSLEFHGRFLGAKGKYPWVARPFDPCASECQPRQVLEPIRPDGTLASQEDSTGPEGRGPSRRLEGIFIDACGRRFDSITVKGKTLWAHDGHRVIAYTRSSRRGHDTVTFAGNPLWLNFTAIPDGGSRYRYRMQWIAAGSGTSWSEEEWEFVPKAEWERAFAARDPLSEAWLACRRNGRSREF